MGNNLLLSKVQSFSTSQLTTSLLVSFAQGQGGQIISKPDKVSCLGGASYFIDVSV